MSGRWAGSTRKARLPKGWDAKRARILKRDRYQCRIVLPGCTGRATDVDHIKAGDDHSDGNLQAACSWCHGRKSAAEGAAARKARGYVTQRRQRERHPGLVTPSGG